MKVLSFPLFETFPLVSDDEGVAQVTVRQATEGENIERNELFSRTRRIYNDGKAEVTLEQDYNVRKLRRKEAYLTLGKVVGMVIESTGAELFKYADTGDGPRVRMAMSEDEFNQAWNRLPAPVAEEIVGYVHNVNPDWDPNSGN
jgi:hypothetical protein